MPETIDNDLPLPVGMITIQDGHLVPLPFRDRYGCLVQDQGGSCRLIRVPAGTW